MNCYEGELIKEDNDRQDMDDDQALLDTEGQSSHEITESNHSSKPPPPPTPCPHPPKLSAPAIRYGVYGFRQKVHIMPDRSHMDSFGCYGFTTYFICLSY
jgi:hypothetical protein